MSKPIYVGIATILAMSVSTAAFGQGAMQGSAHGGQQPISGSHVYLFSPASGAIGTPSVSLITSGTGTDATGTYVTTDANGDFSINQVQCPSADVPEYAYVSMGNAGFGSNSAISMMAYVGLCGTLATVNIDEATTVATAYAVAGYATDPLHISYSGTSASLTGVQNAFANAANLVNMAYGTTNAEIPSGNATVPQATINTIADALASCINETTQGTNTSYCAELFYATSVNGVAPIDTATAAMNIAHNPANSAAAGIQNGTNIANILYLANKYQQFSPILSVSPNDLTLGLTFSGSNSHIANATALAIDGSGNAWIASQQSPSLPNGSVVEIANPTTMQANGLTYPVVYTPQVEPDSIAVDGASQNIWIGTDNAVEEFSNAAVPAAGSPFLTTDLNFGGGYALNLDSAGNIWIAAYSSVYELSPTGTVITTTTGAGKIEYPSALALDGSNNVWVTDEQEESLVELNSSGSAIANIGPTDNPNPIDLPTGVAIDSSKDVWIANNGNNNFVEYVPSQGMTQLTYDPANNTLPNPYSNPLLTFVAIDGAGNSWFSLENAACISSSVCLGVTEVSGAGKPLSGPGYVVGGNSMGDATANATAIDGSGNVWILNKYAQSVTELVGAAAPVVTPLALAVSSNLVGARP